LPAGLDRFQPGLVIFFFSDHAEARFSLKRKEFFIKKKGVSNNNLETVIQGYRTPTNNEHHKAIT